MGEFLKNEFRSIKTFRVVEAASGAIFGLALGVVAGFNPVAIFICSSITAFLVAFAGSLIKFLLGIVVSFFVSTVAFEIYFWFFSSPISPLFVQVCLLLALCLGQIFVFIMSRHEVSNVFPETRAFGLILSSFFLLLVLALRRLMPTDPLHVLDALYPSEDNAGIIAVLSNALGAGVGNGSLGVFSNTLYVGLSALIALVSSGDSLLLLAPLTHWNLTVGYLALAPVTSYLAVSLMGTKTKLGNQLIVWIFTTGVVIVLIWPFAAMGHTSALLATQLAIPVFTLVVNKTFLRANPILYTATLSSLGLLASNVWFPLLPLMLFGIVMVSIDLIRARKLIGTTGFLGSIGVLGISTVVIAADLLPFFRVSLSDLDELPSGFQKTLEVFMSVGGSRIATSTTVVLWAILILATSLSISHWRGESRENPNIRFAQLLTAAVATSGGFLLIGLVTNDGSPGYGATKYLIVIISVTIPAMMVLALRLYEGNLTSIVLASGTLLLALILSQGELGNLGKSTLFSIEPPKTSSEIHPDVRSLVAALKDDPDQILCTDQAQDFNTPQAEPERSYLCSRWGSSLVGADFGDAILWRYSLLDRIPKTEMPRVANLQKGSKLALLYFVRESITGKPWWSEISGQSWILRQVK